MASQSWIQYGDSIARPVRDPDLSTSRHECQTVRIIGSGWNYFNHPVRLRIKNGKFPLGSPHREEDFSAILGPFQPAGLRTDIGDPRKLSSCMDIQNDQKPRGLGVCFGIPGVGHVQLFPVGRKGETGWTRFS